MGKRHKEALVIYERAKVMLVQSKQENAYRVLLNQMALASTEVLQGSSRA